MTITNFETILRAIVDSNDPLGFKGSWREAAVRAHVIPVYSDWTETCFALTDEGDVVHSDTSWENAQRLTNSRYRHIVLAQAAARYPELSELRPVRQPDDPDCRSCGGTGVVRVGEKKYDDFICECGGLGWYPRNASWSRSSTAPAAYAAQLLDRCLLTSILLLSVSLSRAGNGT